MKIYPSREIEILNKVVNLKENMSDDEFKLLYNYVDSYVKFESDFLQNETRDARRAMLREADLSVIAERDDEIVNDPDSIHAYLDSKYDPLKKRTMEYIMSVSKTFLKTKNIIKLQQFLLRKLIESPEKKEIFKEQVAAQNESPNTLLGEAEENDNELSEDEDFEVDSEEVTEEES